MKEFRRRIGKTFERQQKLYNDALSPLSDEERIVFLDTIYGLPGITAFLDEKSEEYDETSSESFRIFIDRYFSEYKAKFEKKNKSKVCR